MMAFTMHTFRSYAELRTRHRGAQEDGCEIMWAEHAPGKLKNLRQLIKQRGEFAQ